MGSVAVAISRIIRSALGLSLVVVEFVVMATFRIVVRIRFFVRVVG